MNPSDIPPGIDPDAAFSLCVRFGKFVYKNDDGSSVPMDRIDAEWVVYYRGYNMEKLHKDLAGRVKWGRGQELEVWYCEKSNGVQEILDDWGLVRAFSERWDQRRMFLYVKIVDKPGQLVANSGFMVSESATSTIAVENGIAQSASSIQHGIVADAPAPLDVHDAPAPLDVTVVPVQAPAAIDWDSLEIAPIAEADIGVAIAPMEEDAMYTYVGLIAEAERARAAAEKAKVAAENEAAAEKARATAQAAASAGDVEGVETAVDDLIPGETHVVYDRESPPMIAGSTYADMDEFRMAVRQHAIKGEFELGTEKSEPDRFRGYCTAEGCPWAIVARLTQDNKSVRFTMINFSHECASTGRVKTKMTTYHWVAEKATPLLKKKPNMGPKALKEELEDMYSVVIGYSTVCAGRQKALDQIFGSWEESFGQLYRFKAEVELRSPGSVVEIDVKEDGDEVYFHIFFCCLKPSIDGFLNGCRPYLSVDSTALNGRWNGHLASATALDGHNWMFPVAFGFFDAETTENWSWFFEQVQKAIGNPPNLAISSDACKGLANAVKKVYPWAEHRECFRHLMENFVKKFQGPIFGNMYPAARTFREERFQYYMNKMLVVHPEVATWLNKWHPLLWMRCRFSEQIKSDYITNNLAESWNKLVKEIKDLPVTELADTLRSMIMQLYEKRRRIGERLQGVMLPAVVRQLNAMTRGNGHLRVTKGANHTAEVTEITAEHEIIRHVVKLKFHGCTCREWQVSEKPCPHALALITTDRNHNMHEFLSPYFSVNTFRLAYAGVIEPLTDKSQWPNVELGFKVLPPLGKRAVGRQKKNRILGCLEKGNSKQRSKGKWKVRCKRCDGLGHRETSAKCPLNGTKKRKSRAKMGRPPSDASCSGIFQLRPLNS